ncbi:MAG: adenylyltransferase/cytidyltransferase family protein [Patescibacteria group bacterium]
MSKKVVKKQKKAMVNQRFIKNFNDLNKIVGSLKILGNRIILTQGVYDLIHEGHAKYLEIAKSHGDILIVGVDSDALTRQRKGPSRPIVPEAERIEMLLHLRHVDYVVVRDVGKEIGDLIRTVKPDILITSSTTKDFTREFIKKYKSHCGQIITLPAQSTTSTTARIRKLSIDGASSLADEINKLTKEFIEKIRGI